MMEIDLESITVNLPEEIITEILLRLPVKSLLRFRCVSKSWLFLISSYKFATAHLKISTNNNAYIHDKLLFGSTFLPMDLYTCSLQSVIECCDLTVPIYPPLNDDLFFDRARFVCPFHEPDDVIWLVGSCNGLVCVHLSHNTIILWNPTTRKSKTLPDSGTDLDFECYSITYAFGYDEPHDDYKVVEIFGVERVPGTHDTQVKVYSLRNNTWKTLSNWPRRDTFGGAGKFLNGAVHWSVCDYDRAANWSIVAQDLATDAFIELALPKLDDDDDDDVRVEVKILGGCLALCCEHNVHMDVWAMREYGVKGSWTKLARIPFFLDFADHELIRPCPLFFSSDGKVLMNYGTSLRLYDINTTQPHLFSSDFSVEATTYFESLVSPSLDDEVVIIGQILPQEVITEILFRLPVKSLMRFKSVSKGWLSLISSSQFVKAHLKTSTKYKEKLIFGPRLIGLGLYTCSINSIIEGSVFADPDHALLGTVYTLEGENFPFDTVWFDPPVVEENSELRLVGSCNGLVCLSLCHNIIILVNPATGISRILPSSGTDDYYFKVCKCSYSFGYDEVYGDYKVVELIHFEYQINAYVSFVQVYSMRANSWKNILNWPGGETSQPGKFLNGSLHWSVKHLDRLTKWVISSYDLANETFVQLPLPCLADQDNAIVELDILGGCLAAVYFNVNNVETDIWVMKERGVRESWTKVVCIPFTRDPLGFEFAKPRPVFLSADGKILMKYGSCLKIYDPSNPQPHHFDTLSLIDATTYVESLVSLTPDEEENNNSNP